MSPILSWLVFLSRYSWSCNIFHLLHQIRADLEIFSHYKSTVIKKKISNCTTALVSDTTLQNQNTVYRWAAAHVTEACVYEIRYVAFTFVCTSSSGGTSSHSAARMSVWSPQLCSALPWSHIGRRALARPRNGDHCLSQLFQWASPLRAQTTNNYQNISCSETAEMQAAEPPACLALLLLSCECEWLLDGPELWDLGRKFTGIIFQ